MMLFCDQCGMEFAPGTLRSESKFCPSCGKELSDYVKSQCVNLFSPSTTPTRKRTGKADTPRSAEKNPRKKRSVDNDKRDQDHDHETGKPGSRETRGRRRKSTIQPNAVAEADVNDQTTSSSSREDDETDVSHF
jgi:predicted  nucleic acid-binding Zn-ribbon protein